MSRKFTSTIAGASIFISALMLVGRGFGFIREIIYAGYFGTGGQFDLYLVGAVLPITLNTIIYYLGQNYFMPSYSKIVATNPSEASNFSTQVFGIFILGGIGLSILLIFFSNSIVDLYLHTSSEDITVVAGKIFRIFVLTIPLSAGISILSSYLQAKLEFKYPSISNLFLNLSIIILVFVAAKDVGIYAIPIGYTLGILIQFSYLIYKVNKFGEFKFKKFRFEKSYIKSTIKSSLIIIVLIESIGQLYVIADRFFYNSVDVGGIASLNYAQNLFLFPIAIFSFALGTAIFPKISGAFSRQAYNDLNKILNESIKVSVVIFIPISLLFIFYGQTIVKLIYERGNFTSVGTGMTFETLRLLALSMVLYSVYVILNKTFYSANLVKSLLIITIIGMFLKIFFNIILVKYYQQNGLALSTSLSYFSYFIMSFIVLRRKVKLSAFSVFVPEVIINLFNGLLSYSLTLLMEGIIFPASDKRLTSIFLFCIIYFLNLYITNHSSIKTIRSLFSRFTLGTNNVNL